MCVSSCQWTHMDFAPTHKLAHAYTPLWIMCSTVTRWLEPRDSSQRSMSQLAREELSGAHLISQAVSALVWRGMTSHRHHQGQVSALWLTFNTQYKTECSCLGDKLSLQVFNRFSVGWMLFRILEGHTNVHLIRLKCQAIKPLKTEKWHK